MTAKIQEIIEAALSSTDPQFIGHTVTDLLRQLKDIPEKDHDSIYDVLETIDLHRQRLTQEDSRQLQKQGAKVLQTFIDNGT